MYTELIGKLKKLGFTENEAKIYLGLLSMGEATASEIHEYTHVPRTKTYSTLERMSKKSMWKSSEELRHISGALARNS